MVQVVVVTSAGCHLCGDALECLGELGREFPLEVREVDIDSSEGRDIVRVYHPAMPPAILVDGALFSVGRLPRKKLRRKLERAA